MAHVMALFNGPLRYTVDTINNRTDILPNITLGYVILDSCSKDLAGLAQTLKFVPISDNNNTILWPRNLEKDNIFISGKMMDGIKILYVSIQPVPSSRNNLQTTLRFCQINPGNTM